MFLCCDVVMLLCCYVKGGGARRRCRNKRERKGQKHRPVESGNLLNTCNLLTVSSLFLPPTHTHTHTHPHSHSQSNSGQDLVYPICLLITTPTLDMRGTKEPPGAPAFGAPSPSPISSHLRQTQEFKGAQCSQAEDPGTTRSLKSGLHS